MGCGHPISFRPWAALIAAVCLVGQLVLASAALWHHHDDGDAQHEDCAVCIAVASEKTDGLPPPILAPAPLELTGFVAAPIPPDTSKSVPRHCRARGPPAA